MSNVSDNKTKISWNSFLEKVIDDFKDKGFNFGQISEMHIITTANKMDMSYDFYIKHNMHAIDWRLNGMINKNKTSANKFPHNWRHPLKKILKVIVSE